MNKPLGFCPLCNKDLQLEGDLLICPTGDYKAEAQAFEDRWIQFDKEVAGLKESLDGLALVERLLTDLRALNKKEESVP